MGRYYIGLSTSGHDPAFAIADSSGEIIFAEATERFTQVKRAWGIAPDLYDHIAPHLNRIIDTDPNAQFSVSTSWTREKQNIYGDSKTAKASPSTLLIPEEYGLWLLGLQAQIHAGSAHNIKSMFKGRVDEDIKHYDHHLCHALNGVYSASFDNGMVLVVDGEGETGSISLFEMQNRKLKRKWRSWGPGSLGTFYCWLTSLCGFDWVAGEEWKVMGLAAYGVADLSVASLLEQVLEFENGRPVFAEQQTVAKIVEAMQVFKRHHEAPVEKAADLAATAQLVYQRFMCKVLDEVENYKHNNLILSGGCALNSSFNGWLFKTGKFNAIHVPSAPADDGNAIGSAIANYISCTEQSIPSAKNSCYLGTKPNQKAIESTAKNSGWHVKRLKDDSPAFIAEQLSKGKIIGVFRGAAEFGPRALGHRSILADPRSHEMKSIINEKVKGRELYRPFAPIIKEELLSEWFDADQPSPYMAFAYPFHKDKANQVSAVVHEDNTGRVQTVNSTSEPWLYTLLSEFESLSGVPILLNTSFNVMGKPIVHSVEDAVSVFATSGLDGLLLENVYFYK